MCVKVCMAVACHCPFQETGRVPLCTHVRAFTFASPLHTWQELLVPAHLALCALSWCEEGKRRVSECGWVYTAGVGYFDHTNRMRNACTHAHTRLPSPECDLHVTMSLYRNTGVWVLRPDKQNDKHTHTHAHTHTHTSRTHTHNTHTSHTHTHNTHAHTRTHAHKHTHTARMSTHTHTNTHTQHARAHTHTQTHTHSTHEHTHTHTVVNTSQE